MRFVHSSNFKCHCTPTAAVTSPATPRACVRHKWASPHTLCDCGNHKDKVIMGFTPPFLQKVIMHESCGEQAVSLMVVRMHEPEGHQNWEGLSLKEFLL